MTGTLFNVGAGCLMVLLLWHAAIAQAPLTLDRIIERVLQRNLAVEAARHRVERARAEQIAAPLRPNPSLTVAAENLKLSGPTSFGELYEISGTYSQPIELGDKRRLRREVADQGVSVAEAQLAELLQQRLFEAKRAYYELLLARGSLEQAMEQRGAFDELVRFNQVRFEEGEIAEGELLKVKLERVKFDTAVAQAQLAVRQTGIKLLDLLGESEFSAAGQVAGELRLTPLAVDLVLLRETALNYRPSLQVADRSALLAGRRIALERARVFPDISPFVGARRVGENNTVLFGVTIPLPFNDRNQAAIARAIADEKVAQAEFAIQRNRVLADVESAFRAWEIAREQVAVFEGGLLSQADESLAIARAAYQEGAIELLGLLEAQRARAEIRQQYLRSLFDHQVSLGLLELAVGKTLGP
jgi:cobalt-zinc-cadmium efflux system outer membrane protein